MKSGTAKRAQSGLGDAVGFGGMLPGAGSGDAESPAGPGGAHGSPRLAFCMVPVSRLWTGGSPWAWGTNLRLEISDLRWGSGPSKQVGLLLGVPAGGVGKDKASAKAQRIAGGLEGVS